MPPRESRLVEWAKSGAFDVQRAESLAAAYRAPWQVNEPSSDVVEPAKSTAGLSSRELIGAADTLVANDNASPSAPLASTPSDAPPFRRRMASEPVEIPVSKSRRLGLIVAAAASLTLLLALAVWALRLGSSSETAKSSSQAAAATKASAPRTSNTAPAPSPPVQAKAAAPARVAVSITVHPPEASLRLDGDEVSNPYQGELEQGSSHAFVAQADGYVDRELKLRFDKPRELTVKLKARPVAKPKPQVAKRPARTERPARAEARRPAKKTTAPKGAGFVTDNPY